LLFTGLGIWQVERRSWKLALIAAVDARVPAAAVPAPGPAEWPRVTAEDDAYRHVRAVGVFLDDHETLVQAVTELGGGFWVLTPLRSDAGFTVLVNRGFVPQDRADPATRPDSQPMGHVAVTGLLRITEPGGAFLRSNDLAADRWFSRDVAAIAQARGLENVAPYFIDADANPDANALPVGGLTVISFWNNHLVYAITWFSLAVLSLAGLAVLFRSERLPGARTSG
jgi:surfeit locus 1 family protein